MNENVVDGIRPLVADLVGALDRFEPEDAAELEEIALDAIGPFGHPGLPDEVVALLPEALHERGDETAAGVLAVLAELGPPPLRTYATEARDRLASAGVRSPLASEVGMLEVRECRSGRIEATGAEELAVLLGGSGREDKAVALFLEHEPCGGVVTNMAVGNRNLFAFAAGEAVRKGELEAKITAALAHMVEHNVELDVDDLPALLLLERALTGTTGQWPRPALAEPDLTGEELVDVFEAERGPDEGFVAELMRWWKEDYGDGPIDEWTAGDLREFMLDWYPRKGDSDDESIALVPGAVVQFLRFLDVDDLDTLAAEVERLRPEFERRVRDPRNWGPSKALVTQMRSEGVHPASKEALDAWMAGFNARPFEERDRVLGPSLPPRAPGNAQRRKTQRKSVKVARKRNRR